MPKSSRAGRPAPQVRKRGRWLRSIVLFFATIFLGIYLLAVVELAALRWLDPPTTMVQLQRRLEAQLTHKPYQKRQTWVGLDLIAPHLQHAVIAAEDGRFFQHH